MFRPLAVFIGLRYSRAKRRQYFVSFISLASMLGIALGVTVLITVLSVMNGFDYEIRHRIFGMTPQVTVTELDGGLAHWQLLAKKIQQYPNVSAVAPFVDGQAMLSHDGEVSPVLVRGIIPKRENHVSQMQKSFVDGRLNNLVPGKFGIILGDQLAANLGVMPGDKVTLLSARPGMSPMGIMPRFKRFNVVGIFHIGGGFGFDKGVAYMQLNDAQKFYHMGDTISGLRLKVSDLYVAPHVAQQLRKHLSNRYLVSDWTKEFGAFFKAVRMEKSMMFIILLLIIAVAAFNLVSTLVMVVTDKQAEIAILKTLGASPRMIMSTFMVQGLSIGVVGTLLGLIGGIVVALNVTHVVAFIEHILHVQFISSSVYFINYLPSRLLWGDVFHVCGFALLMSLIATLYPAWQASRTQPAEALRYE